MTILHLQADELPRLTGTRQSRILARISRALRSLRAALRTVHRAIVIAKTRRLKRELMFHSRSNDDESSRPAKDAAKFPLMPLILGDKWDF